MSELDLMFREWKHCVHSIKYLNNWMIKRSFMYLRWISLNFLVWNGPCCMAGDVCSSHSPFPLPCLSWDMYGNPLYNLYSSILGIYLCVQVGSLDGSLWTGYIPDIGHSKCSRCTSFTCPTCLKKKKKGQIVSHQNNGNGLQISLCP